MTVNRISGTRAPRYGGFTLIEVVVVVSLLATIAAIAVPRYMGLSERADVSVMKADLYHLRLARERYRQGGAGVYSAGVSVLDFQTSPDVEIAISEAGPDGYVAVAGHRRRHQRCSYSTTDGVARCALTDERGQRAPAQPDSVLATH